MTPTVIIVGADKGGVGKTTVTRLLLDYLRSNAIDFLAYDTEHPAGSLKRFYPDKTEVVDLTKSDDQMKVFDNLSPTQVSVVDVRAGLLTPTLTMLRETGIGELAQMGKLRIIVLHVLGPATQSLEEIAPIMAALAGSRHVAVANHINDTEYKAPADAVVIPKLDEKAAKIVDGAGVPFSTFVASGASFILGGKVNHWLSQAFTAFNESKLNVLT